MEFFYNGSNNNGLWLVILKKTDSLPAIFTCSDPANDRPENRDTDIVYDNWLRQKRWENLDGTLTKLL